MAVKGPNFTTQELVKEAGIALQTFYRYFGSKDHLHLAVIEDTNRWTFAELAAEVNRIAAVLQEKVKGDTVGVLLLNSQSKSPT